jgi:tetratricopeptide (TPR) repeat protein
MGKDTYVEARGAVDDLTAAHNRAPRARALAAYAAIAAFAYEVRFGADPERDSRAKGWLAELKDEPDVRYYNVALAAQDAAAGNWDKAAKALDAAAKRDAGDPIQQDIALLRGIVALKLDDGAGAKTAFETALKLAPSARAHFGLGLALRETGDQEGAEKEVDATLAATPNHPSALIARANLRWQKRDEKGAFEDVATVVEGTAKALASPHESAEALSLRGAIHAGRGRGGEARTAYEAALKIEARNVNALVGLGLVYLDESRYTEALTRLDTALQASPDNPVIIALDVLTKAKLERLKEAKDQIVAARARFPKSMRLATAAAAVEMALGNKVAAEKALSESIDLVRPEDGPKALEPYLMLAMLLVADGRAKDADTKLDEMRTKLPESVEMERAVGGYEAAQGHFDGAIAHFRRAIELDQQDLSTRFQLAVTLRRMRRMDESAIEFDKVLAADKDYPGLALERGLLYEESGEVEKALEQFKNALAKAPDDPDLMLRVGAAYVAIGRPDDALPILRKVLEKRAQSAEANHYLGRALLAKGGGNMTEAMRNLKHAVELDPNRAEFHLYVAWAANESNPVQLGLAKEEVEKALALDKLLADAYWQRGVTERKEGAVEDALKDLQHALELKPSRIEAHAVMAECYEDKNDEGSAVAQWQKAIGANDRQPYWRYRYGKLLQQKHASAEAAKHLTFAVQEGEKMDGGRPPWLANAQFFAAEALRASGKKQEAIELYEKFLAVAPMSSPDRRDAINALSDLGKPWNGGRK